MTPDTDHTFGLRSEDNQIFIGNKPVAFEGDDIFVEGIRHKGTPGLWELIVKKEPDRSLYDPDDLDYAEILRISDAMYQGNSSLSRTSKASQSFKWNYIIKPIYRQEKYGSELQTVFLPSNFDQLLDRLKPCAASYQAGNNGVCNEIVAILDTLKKARHISLEEYKLHLSIL